LTTLFAALVLTAVARAEPPNVVVILTDDQGWGDLSLHGNHDLKTPHLDSLAREGARFERFFVQPVCSPTRAEFLTGRYHPRGGVRGVSTGAERLNLDEKTIADAFRAAGYATACFGKWHNGSQYPYHPRGRGFEEYYGFTSGHWGDYFAPPLDHNGEAVTGKGYLTDDLTDRAIAYFQSVKDRPFFVYLAYNTPHSPMQVPDRFWGRFVKRKLTMEPEQDDSHTRAALAMCENIDENVGRLLAALDQRQQAHDTIVVYFSDNGPNGRRWNGGMRGIKGSTDEGGTRSPLHIRWPAAIKPGTVISRIAGAIDLLPTLTDLAGVKPVSTKPMDGVSFATELRGQTSTPPERFLFQHWAGRTSARSQRYRLDGMGRLYDLGSDPGQTTDIAGQKPKEVQRHREAVAAWQREVLSTSGTGDRPYPVGYSAMPRTVLPARDGLPHGGVRRSAPAPNCSFFTHWTNTEGHMTWDVEVATPGRYEAIVQYTCAPADVGSSVVLSLGDATWKGKVAEAHDPPLRGKENDRADRKSESYVKDFRPMSLGVATVAKGRGVLTLKAAHVAGSQVMDVRAVELRLMK
jgi:arylsulfatase A-like enzyme